MDKYREATLDFERNEMMAKGKFNAKEFVIIVGILEYSEMLTLGEEHSATYMRGNDGEFDGFYVKKLNISSAFNIMSVDVFNTIVSETKKEMIQGLGRLNLLMELR